MSNVMDDIINEFDYDATGVEMDQYAPVPDGEYNLIIKDVKPQKSKNGDYQVVVDFEILDASYAGKKVRHWVTFFPPKDAEGKPIKGAGMALYFLQVIGEPHDATKLSIKPFSWVGKQAKAELKTEEYKGKKNNKIKWFVKPLDGKLEEPEEIPF